VKPTIGAKHRCGLLAGYAVVTFFSFPHPLGDGVVDFGRVLAWFGPALLLLGITGLSPRRAAKVAFVASLFAHAALLHWFYVVTVTYGHAPALVGLLAPFGPAAYIAASTAIFAASMAGLARVGCDSAWSAALAWTALDHLRSFAFSGFPWATLGYAQHENAALLSLAAFTGVYGLSFVSVLGAAALAEFVRAWPRRLPSPGAGLAVATVAAVLLSGALSAGPDDEGDLTRVRVAVLQGNIEQGVKWSDAWSDQILEIYQDLAREAAAQGAEWIVWPESSVPGLIDIDPGLRLRLKDLARETGAIHVLGAVGLRQGAAAQRPNFYDSAVILDPDGGFGARYDKSHLVPFGEYVPLRSLLGFVLTAIARGVAPDNVTAGPGPRALEFPALSGPAATLTAGVPICYELIFPDLVRRMVGDGAEVLLALTNDAWYGRTGAPYQFLAMTALRSAESRVWTARAANTGVSAIIDSRGRVRERTRIFERGLLLADVPLRPAPHGGSFYARHGDVFAAACWTGFGGIALLGLVRSRRGSGKGERDGK
jgi:apolipoprotein N-acyltransferase